MRAVRAVQHVLFGDSDCPPWYYCPEQPCELDQVCLGGGVIQSMSMVTGWDRNL